LFLLLLFLLLLLGFAKARIVFFKSRVWLDGFQQVMAQMIEGIDADDGIDKFSQKYFFFIFEIIFSFLRKFCISYFLSLAGWISTIDGSYDKKD